MDQSKYVDIPVLEDFRIVRPDATKDSEARTDMMVAYLRVGGRDLPLAIDRRTAERLSKSLSTIAKKLTLPRDEH